MADDVNVLPLKAGETYAFCRCGKSGNKPYCDGSHAGSGHSPMVFRPSADTEVRFCACGKSQKQPFCDGSHLQK